MLLYSIVLTLALVLSAPWWLVRMATTQKYREGLGERLGRVPGRLRQAVSGKRVLWLHAVSVGEVLAASRLLAELGEALGPEWLVVISTTTRTGQALARERFGAERVFYMPLDFAWAVRAYLRALKPAALVLMESEVWPRVLQECKRAGVPVAVVNARVSDRSFARGRKLRGLWGRVLRGVTLWLAQSDDDAHRLVEMGARAECVRVSGNLKFDVRAPKESRVAERIREVAAGRTIVVGGSLVGEDPPEESPLIRAQQSFAAAERPLLVLAPRHPERFGEVYAMAAEYPAALATELLQGAANNAPEIIVLDTIGDLAAVYGIADVAFVGGSLVKRGGHNPLEPAQFGVPIVMGPSFENFRAVVHAMRDAQAISIVGENAGEPLSTRDVSAELGSALSDELHRLLEQPAWARTMGERGRQVFEAQQGATARTVEAILKLVRR